MSDELVWRAVRDELWLGHRQVMDAIAAARASLEARLDRMIEAGTERTARAEQLLREIQASREQRGA